MYITHTVGSLVKLKDHVKGYAPAPIGLIVSRRPVNWDSRPLWICRVQFCNGDCREIISYNLELLQQ